MIKTLYYLTLDTKDTSIAIWKQSNDHRNGVLRVKRENRDERVTNFQMNSP